MLENKSDNISETRKDRGKVTMDGLQKLTNALSNGTISDSYGLPFPKIWGLQLSYPLLSQDQVKLRTSNLAGTFTGPIQVKAHSKFSRKWSVGIFRDCPVFWVPPIISGMGKATDFKFGGYIYRAYPNKSQLKFFLTKWSVGVSMDCTNFLGTPYYLRNG